MTTINQELRTGTLAGRSPRRAKSRIAGRRALLSVRMSCLMSLLHSIIRELCAPLLEHPKNIYTTIVVPRRLH